MDTVRKLRCCWPALLVSAFSFSTMAAPEASNKAAAEALFVRAQSQLEQAQYEQACENFAASQELDPALGTLLYLADCYEQIDKTASAWAVFRQAADVAARDGDEKRGKLAEVRATALKPRLHYVLLQVGAVPEGFELRQQGQLVAEQTYAFPLPVDPGALRFEATAPEHERWTSEITIPKTPGESRVIIPELKPLARKPAPVLSVAPPPQPASDPGAGGWRQGHTALLVSGVGLVAVGVGSYFGVQALSQNDDSNRSCDGNVCDPDGFKLRSDALDSATVATTGFIAGGVLLAGGLTLWLTAPNDPVKLEAAMGPTSAALKVKSQW